MTALILGAVAALLLTLIGYDIATRAPRHAARHRTPGAASDDYNPLPAWVRASIRAGVA